MSGVADLYEQVAAEMVTTANVGAEGPERDSCTEVASELLSLANLTLGRSRRRAERAKGET